MRLAPIAASLSVAAFLATAGIPASYAQSADQQNTSNQSQQNQPAAKPPASQPVPVMVTVAPGDTLDGIATAHQTTYVRLFDANTNITDPNLIYPGDQLRIPDPSEQLPNRPLPSDAAVPVNETQPTTVSAPAPSLPAVQSAPVTGCGDNSYANYIYSHESGCRTTAMSTNGCYGIGQACPASKIAYCGADYACQNAFFTAYAGKYGGWAGAYAFWVSHGWW